MDKTWYRLIQSYQHWQWTKNIYWINQPQAYYPSQQTLYHHSRESNWTNPVRLSNCRELVGSQAHRPVQSWWRATPRYSTLLPQRMLWERQLFCQTTGSQMPCLRLSELRVWDWIPPLWSWCGCCGRCWTRGREGRRLRYTDKDGGGGYQIHHHDSNVDSIYKVWISSIKRHVMVWSFFITVPSVRYCTPLQTSSMQFAFPKSSTNIHTPRVVYKKKTRQR